MGLRRRIALFLDPTLYISDETWLWIAAEKSRLRIIGADDSRPRETDPDRIVWHLDRTAEMATHLEHIAKSLDKMEQRTRKRGGRNVWCTHPELHPEVELVS